MTVFQSFRRRIVVWFLVLLGVTLAALGLTTRTILDAGISEHANADVRQEIDEFQRFAADGTDPATAAAFDSGRRLLEVYLSRQIPGRDEHFATGHIREAAHLVRVIRGEEELSVKKCEVLNVIHALEGLYQSAARGQEVQLAW